MSLRAAQTMVRDFHLRFGQPEREGKTPGLFDVGLRVSLIVEEAAETAIAALRGDLPGAVDGLCDLIYVCLGAAVRWGVDLDPIFEAVHLSNMAKGDGPVRADGKILKPPGWVPPDVAGLLRNQVWK